MPYTEAEAIHKTLEKKILRVFFSPLEVVALLTNGHLTGGAQNGCLGSTILTTSFFNPCFIARFYINLIFITKPCRLYIFPRLV